MVVSFFPCFLLKTIALLVHTLHAHLEIILRQLNKGSKGEGQTVQK